MFLKIDDWLFNRVFQPFADWFCDHTGRNPLWLAATAIYLFVAGTVIDNTLFRYIWSQKAFDIFFCLFLIFKAISYDRDSTAPNSQGLTINPHRPNTLHRFVRIALVILLPVDVFDIIIAHPGQGVTHSDGLDFLRQVMLMSFLYFEACETKPPAPPKKKSETVLADADA